MTRNILYPVKENYQLVDQFDSSFWSGLDCQVYVGNVWLKDAVQVSYQVLETVRPYWHYSRHVASRLHHGTRIIQGEFTINYTRDSYFFSLLSRLGSDMLSAENPVPELPNISDVARNVNMWGGQPSRTVTQDHMTADQKRDYVLARKAALTRQDLIRADIASSRPTIPHNRGLFETPSDFNLYLVFGAFLPNPLKLRFIADEREYYLDGAVVQDTRPNPAPMGTGLKIKGVSIMGAAKTIGDDGRPIMETYSFMAKDVGILYSADLAEFPNYATPMASIASNELGGLTNVNDALALMQGAFA